ncbi:MAG TPA: hypothetical protein VIO80_15155 [Candidatus Dormibacteraeota bacterium]
MPVAVTRLDVGRSRAVSGTRDFAGKWGMLDAPPDKHVLPRLNVGAHLHRQACEPLDPIRLMVYRLVSSWLLPGVGGHL